MRRGWTAATAIATLVLIGAVAIGWSDTGVPGTPVVSESTAAESPSVGDCVTDPTGLSQANAFGRTDPAQSLQLGPCIGQRWGEVVEIYAEPKDLIPVGDSGRFSDPQAEPCARAAESYVGIPALDLEAPAFAWRPSLRIQALLAGPNAEQRAAGQHWLACVVAAEPSVADSSEAFPTLPGSVQDAATTGSGRQSWGRCQPDQDDLTPADPNCLTPHRAELLGHAFVAAASTRSDALADCREWVTQSTGLTDPTAAGQLDLFLVAYNDRGEKLTTEELPARASLVCGVTTTGDRTLVDSLVATGDEPLPWG